jgi:ABC-type sugar transport system permease subunit
MFLEWIKKQGKLFYEIWPLIPAAAYLIGFLIIIGIYLINLSLTFANAGIIYYPTLKTFYDVFSNPKFLHALISTTIFVVIGTPLELIAGLFLALILYKSFIFRNFIRSIFLIPLAIPALVTATLLFILFDFPGGHINHLLMGKYPLFPQLIQEALNWRASEFLALGISMIGKIWRDMPISMLILLAGLNSIDPELFDSAKTMGAGIRQRIIYIILPLIIPSISAVVLLRSIEMWKEFIFPFVLAGKYNLLSTLIESFYNDWGNSYAASVVALIMVFCIIITAYLFILLMEYFKKRILRS